MTDYIAEIGRPLGRRAPVPTLAMMPGPTGPGADANYDGLWPGPMDPGAGDTREGCCLGRRASAPAIGP